MRIFRMILECVTPLHCGGMDDLIQDQPVTRDAFGLWRIPGSSLAGSLRSLASRMDESLADKMFGCAKNDRPAPSLVWCEDGLLLDFDGQTAMDRKLAGKNVALPAGPFVRDHVCLDLEKGSAVEGGKFDAEIVPAGARFFVEFRCDGWDRELTGVEEDFFTRLCALAAGGCLGLGGKSGNGYGRYRVVQCQCRNLDLRNAGDMTTWLNLSRHAMFAPGEGADIAIVPESMPGSDGLDGSLVLALQCDAPLLIGGGQPRLPDGTISEADIIFALSPRLDYAEKTIAWLPVIPGSALKGVLRHAVYRILRDMGEDTAAATETLNGLFGNVADETAQCGRIVVEDCPLEPANAPRRLTQHVAIDRFTGGAQDGALFNEEPVWTRHISLKPRIHVRQASGGEACLFFQAILDLAQGFLGVGNGVNRGNGRLGARDCSGPASILAGMEGSLAWKGAPILAGDGAKRLRTLQTLAREWENALPKKAQA